MTQEVRCGAPSRTDQVETVLIPFQYLFLFQIFLMMIGIVTVIIIIKNKYGKVWGTGHFGQYPTAISVGPSKWVFPKG